MLIMRSCLPTCVLTIVTSASYSESVAPAITVSAGRTCRTWKAWSHLPSIRERIAPSLNEDRQSHLLVCPCSIAPSSQSSNRWRPSPRKPADRSCLTESTHVAPAVSEILASLAFLARQAVIALALSYHVSQCPTSSTIVPASFPELGCAFHPLSAVLSGQAQ